MIGPPRPLFRSSTRVDLHDYQRNLLPHQSTLSAFSILSVQSYNDVKKNTAIGVWIYKNIFLNGALDAEL
jgi:hypothetical protein